jgi:hypothetical protein
MNDLAGRPARGVIEVAPSAGAAAAYGSTDQSGTIRFDAIPEWDYFVRGYLPGDPEVDLGTYESPVPSAEKLQWRTAVIPQAIFSAADAKLAVALRAQSVGYVRGVVRAPAGHTSKEYQAFVDGTEGRAARQHYRPSTGEFAAGPFAPGKLRVRVISAASGQDDLVAQEVFVEAGKVTQIELNPLSPVDGNGGGGAAVLGMGGVSELSGRPQRLAGRVVLADGRTPALGARVFYFGARDRQPALQGLVDAAGRIHAHGIWRSSGAVEATEEPGDPPGAIVVATLPGYCGATAQALGKQSAQSLELVLPQPMSLRGKVTVGGAVPPENCSVRVVAACIGRGRLNATFSVNTTAQADGTFELSGLTPGQYELQAALDDIWLSPATPVKIDGGASASFTLAIAAPGGPLLATLVGSDGRPIRHRAVSIDRPEGELTRALWPTEWKTDGAGQVRFPALEAGQHVLRIKGLSETREVTIPPLTEGKPSTVRIELIEKAQQSR